jgi:hypothetical protein
MWGWIEGGVLMLGIWIWWGGWLREWVEERAHYAK